MLVRVPAVLRSSGIYVWGLLICLLVPLLVIYVPDSHDWGDDFAQYIHQAKNIVEHRSQIDTGFIYDPQYVTVGPPAYPVGFPLLLSPVYWVFGNQMKVFCRYMSFYLFLLGVLLFMFYRRFYSVPLSLLLMLSFIYNPWMIDAKRAILSDLPFAVLLTGCVLLALARHFTRSQSLALGILMTLLVSTRTAGWSFVFALVLWSLLRAGASLRTKRNRMEAGRLLVAPGISLGAMVLGLIILNLLIPCNTAVGYANVYKMSLKSAGTLGHLVFLNANRYIPPISTFFDSPVKDDWRLAGLSVIFRSLFISGLVFGLVRRFRKPAELDIVDFLVPIYMLMLLVYPVDQGFRFVFPVFPFFLRYVLLGLEPHLPPTRLARIAIFAGTAACLVLLYCQSWRAFVVHDAVRFDGPLEKPSVEAFSYIMNQTPADSVIVFRKPRALALYADRKSTRPEQTEDFLRLSKRLGIHGPMYYLFDSEQKEDRFAKMEQKLVWTNKRFSLYAPFQTNQKN